MNPGNSDDNDNLSNAERRRRRRMQSNESQPCCSGSDTHEGGSGAGCLPAGQRVYAEGNGNSGGDCPVCLMPYLYPTVLPCGHMFCYLCIKGIVRSSSSDVIPASCPMCRSNIPRNITMKPTLYEPLKKASENDANEYKWFYQRRKKDGWWRYDDVTSEALENAYLNKERTITVVIAGRNCIVDFEFMAQLSSSKKYSRKIKRDKANSECVGVAGILNCRDKPAVAKRKSTLTEDDFLQKVYRARFVRLIANNNNRNQN